MSSQKKSSTKVGAKKAAPTGQRQFSNLLRSQQAALVKDKSKPKNNVAFVAKSKTMTSQNQSQKQNFRTGPVSELLVSLDPSQGPEYHVVGRYRVNPLSSKTFKRLPSIAQNFESFKFHKLRFRFETRCSTATAGSVILSPSYDAADSDAQAATESLIYANKGTKDFSVWKSEVLELSVASMNRLYKSHTCMSDERFTTTTQDLKTIDPAQVFICLDGVASNLITGKIFLDYDIEFFEPHAPTEPINQGGNTSQFTAVVAASSLPFRATESLSKQESNPILKSLATLVAEGVIPQPTAPNGTSVFGMFTKDWEGIMDIVLDGTGISTLPVVYKSLNPLTSAGSVGDTAVVFNDAVINAAATKLISNMEVNVVAGEYLKLLTPTAASLVSVFSRLGGVSRKAQY